ncbi:MULTISPECIES: relaxase domain-containing protein [Mumia]|uniref:relaxase domain-containing protein n=1 Tax=Mumia TaxID=1546255 RepID=UPI001AB02153|nr:relaxase domain-containing protein [Mumia sp. ZJ430]
MVEGEADVVGVAATAYDHWDSRLGDPQLHTHVVISNKVKTVADKRWRSLDGRPMHAAVVAISEHYNAVLADRLTQVLGVEWEQRDRGRDRNLAWELAPVPEEAGGSATATAGASPASARTARWTCGESEPDSRKRRRCRPATSPSTSSSGTP